MKTALAGKFTGSKYNANYRSGLKNGLNPFIQSPYGKSVSQDTKAWIAKVKDNISKNGSPFAGPVLSQDGKVLIPKGKVPTYAEIEATMTGFVKGVVGEIPKG